MTTTTRRPTTTAAPTITRPSRPVTVHQSWEDRAACLNRPEAWWDGEDKALTAKARRVCLSCPVMADCLADQMRRETPWARASVRGGLTAVERDEMHEDEQEAGPCDAEEARLLALEAEAFQCPIVDLVSQDVGMSTVRLACRLAGEKVEPLTQKGRSQPQDKVMTRIDDVLLWREEGVSLKRIASYLGVGYRTVQAALRKYEALDPTRSGIAEDGFVSQDRVDAYLRGEAVRLEDEQRLQALVTGVGRGLSYSEIDRRRGLANGSTVQFVSRMRKRYERAHRPFPLASSPQRMFTNEQVVEMRERYARGGVTDLQLAMSYGAPRQAVSHVLSGRNYKNVGGPIRQGKRGTQQTNQASRKLFAGHTGVEPAACRMR